MKPTIRQLRIALRKVSRGRSSRSRRYPAELRRAVIRHVLAEQHRGASVRASADFLGLSYETVRLWLAGRSNGRLRAVNVKGAPTTVPVEPPALVVVTVHGHRIEGLSRDDVAYLLRSLP